MRCTHGILYEQKCPQCVSKALINNKQTQTLGPTASKAERDAFWSNEYKKTITKNEY